ncbi:MAG: AAA family ATPase [Desulfomonile tiedjei]|uniref:AAA family ATPase n=1 Tax=Desulfomonile tiedjei TaxID=2358 RepID=A0A9D6V5W5_9BACT|nr:AAA family ATPase [Desulfomonile tiedjei]
MLKAETYELQITPEIRSRIEPKILGALFDSLNEYPARGRAGMRMPMLTVSQAKERLAAELPSYRQTIGEQLPVEWKGSALGPIDVGNTLHLWIKEAITFFRQEGADFIRQGLHAKKIDEFYAFVWNSLFHYRLISLVQSSGLLGDQSGIQTSDIVMECMKLWTKKICEKLINITPESFSPSAFFLDVESDLDATLSFRDRRLRLRGRPDAVFFDHRTGEIHLWEYKFGRQGQYELQIAQVLLYMSLLEYAKGIKCSSGFLSVFRPVEDTSVPNDFSEKLQVEDVRPPFPPEVEMAFEGYVGNDRAVYQLKVDLTLALRERPPRMPENIMLCGPGGLGKTELARRVARTLGTPLIDAPASQIRDLNHLLSIIDTALESKKIPCKKLGDDSGKPHIKYPPLVLFLDEAHELKRKADSYLNLFEPKERRAFGSEHVGDFKDATFLLATTDKGKLPRPFLTRFRMIDLVPYSIEEVALIVKLTLAEKKHEVDLDLCLGLAKIGRLVPRSAIEKASQFMKHHEFRSSEYPLTVAGLKKMMAKVWNVDEHGLTENDKQYLRCVEAGPRGMDTLARLLSCGKEEIANEIEPYLFQLEAVKSTARGREITELGRKILVSGT